MQLLQGIHVGLSRGPSHSKTLGLIGFGDEVEMNMVDLLVGQTAVVLEDVVVLGARCLCYLLGDRQDLEQRLVRDVGQFDTVVFGNHELNMGKMRRSVSWGVGDLEGKNWEVQEGRNLAISVSKTYSMPFTQRLDVEKRKHLLGLE